MTPIGPERSLGDELPLRPWRAFGRSGFFWQLGSTAMQILLRYLAVGAAGSLGCMLRLAVSTLCGRVFGAAFPVGTLVINVSGSLFLGWFLTVISERVVVSDTLRFAVAVGLVGGYTTFSTFMFESHSLLQDGSGFKAMVNLLGSLVTGLLAVRIGIWLGSL